MQIFSSNFDERWFDEIFDLLRFDKFFLRFFISRTFYVITKYRRLFRQIETGFDLFRLDEKLPAKKTSHARKNQEFVVEKVVFETKTEDKKESDEQPKKTSEYKPLESVKQPLEDSTNSTNETTESGKPPKKKVMFNVAETSAENETDKPKRKVPRIPRESTNEVLDAEEECKKMNEQCNQQ